ncbi:MAG: hypothetical protein ACHQ01_01700 [Candidatus Limnocylindrales bacterium]
MNGYLADTATAHTAPEIARAIGPVDDLLRVVRSGSTCEILQVVRFELASALEWRRGNMAAVDAARAEWDRELDHVRDSAEAVERARLLRGLYGDTWAEGLPETAERLGRLVWLDVLDAEDDPDALAGALDRHYPDRIEAAA